MTAVTTFVRDLFHDLKERRLWPLALGLAVALVAVPVVLSKPAKNASAPQPAVTNSTGSVLPLDLQPLVSVTDQQSSSARKSVKRLARKNPFAPKVVSSLTSSPGASATSPLTGGATGPTGPSGVTGGGTTGLTGTTGPSGSTGTQTGAQQKTFYTYVASVRFGETGKTDAKKLQRLRSLPSSDNPLIVFLGATTDGKTAVFLVSSKTQASGDGTCKPDADTCSFVYMKKGDTESFDVADETGALKTYELKLRAITPKKVKGPQSSSASTSSAHETQSSNAAHSQRSSAGRHTSSKVFQVLDLIGF
jgi:hypothetical protein